MDPMFVLQDVPGHRQGYALHPTVVVEVEEERSLGQRLVEDLRGTGSAIEHDDPTMGANAIGHGIEVVLPQVLHPVFHGIELDRAPMHVRLTSVEWVEMMPVVEGFLLLWRDEGDFVCHSVQYAPVPPLSLANDSQHLIQSPWTSSACTRWNR